MPHWPGLPMTPQANGQPANPFDLSLSAHQKCQTLSSHCNVRFTSETRVAERSSGGKSRLVNGWGGFGVGRSHESTRPGFLVGEALISDGCRHATLEMVNGCPASVFCVSPFSRRFGQTGEEGQTNTRQILQARSKTLIGSS